MVITWGTWPVQSRRCGWLVVLEAGVRLSFRVVGVRCRNPFRPLIIGNEREMWGCCVTAAKRSYVSARGLAQLRERLSERDLAIIREVACLRLMSARQIQAVYFPDAEHDNEQAAIRARQRVLTRLIREQLLIRLERRIGGIRAGSAGFVLALGPVGQRVLADSDQRRRFYEPTLRFFDHTLAASQLVVDVQVAARSGMLDLLDWQAEPKSWREFASIGGRRLLRPDLFLALGSGEYELRWFCEIDRATESLPTVRQKCRLYAAYYQAGVEQARGGGVFPRVCWIAPDERRAEQVRFVIKRDKALPDRLFVVTSEAVALDALLGITQ
jgi:hypothetical protein